MGARYGSLIVEKNIQGTQAGLGLIIQKKHTLEIQYSLEAGGKKYIGDQYQYESGDGSSKPKAVNVEDYDEDDD